MENNTKIIKNILSDIHSVNRSVAASIQKENPRIDIRKKVYKELMAIIDKYNTPEIAEYNTISGEVLLSSKEVVNHPDHYNSYPMEVIDMMVKIFGISKTIDFCIINAFKYRMRAGLKGDLQTDINKEQWYLKKAEELKKLRQ